jgi:hypothetical protein
MMIFKVSEDALSYIKDKASIRYLMTSAKIKVFLKSYAEAVVVLDKLLNFDSKNQ